ncbi:MAG TPA: hypothetical protein VKV02_13775, partial [Acidobacteriaceae bacterium]|nr:hypothetical protein [Acidobacteriaceae bacterium]
MVSPRAFSLLRFSALSLLFAGVLPAATPVFAQSDTAVAASEAKKPAAKSESKADTTSSPATPGMPMKQPPLPPDAHVEQSIVLNGKTIHYTATVGTLPVRDEKGDLAGEVVYTAYTVPGKDRPVTFAFNGGPGASSVYLNFGAIGPKRVAFGDQGDSPSDPATLTDNPGTWLDFTDLVFIDPVGTGFSRALVSDDEAKKLFYAPTPDIEYLSLVIYKWLVKNDRMLSKKYVMGESYGGYRGPRITHYLQTQLGVGVNGLFLISPYLNPSFGDGNISPIPWMITLPSITAAHLERQGKLTPDAMHDVIAYTEGPYAAALIAGPQDTAATTAMISKVTDMTGLDPQFVKFSGGRLETGAYLREVHREEGKIGSVYDSNVTDPDPFPYSPEQEGSDPI